QPVDLAGRRSARIDVADRHIAVTEADAALNRLDIIRAVTQAYWVAREAQEAHDILSAAVARVQEIAEYHSAQFRAGVIPEQDLLRVQLEHERLKVTAGVAGLEALRTRAVLLHEIGRPQSQDVRLTEPFDFVDAPASQLSDDSVLAARPEMTRATAAVTEA